MLTMLRHIAQVSAIIFTFLHPIVLLVSFMTVLFHRRRKAGRGAIALPDDEEEANGANQDGRPEGGSRSGASRVWG